jgi:hypothetical protein
MEIKDCKGCIISRDDNGLCLWFNEDIGQCPCSICLVKIICINLCDSLDKHISKVRKSI